MKRPIRSALLALCLSILGACAQPASERLGSAGPANSKEKQAVGYDVAELQRRLVSKLAKLQTYDDVQPESMQDVLGLKLLTSPEQPLSQEGTGELSNSWVFTIWAWPSERGTAPPAPVQMFFYPGNETDYSLWVGAGCFVDTATMIAELQAAGYKVTGEYSNAPLHAIRMVRATASAKFHVRVGNYQPQYAASQTTWCLRDLTVAALPLSSPD